MANNRGRAKSLFLRILWLTARLRNMLVLASHVRVRSSSLFISTNQKAR
jgi:hypothetical protein